MADRTGTDGNDRLEGTADADTINGLGGNDTLIGLEGDDTLNGGDGDDGLLGGPGADTLDGGSDADWASYFLSAAGVTIDLSAALDADGYVRGAGGDAEGDRLKNIEKLQGSAYSDRLTGDGNDNWFRGDAGADTLDGGPGEDWAIYTDSAAGVTIDLSAAPDADGYVRGMWGDAEGDKLKNIENLWGSAYSDRLTGDGNDNFLVGDDGWDNLYGGPGADTLDGGDGWDDLYGGDGADILDGGDGSDEANYEDSAAGVTIDLSATPDAEGYVRGAGGDAEGDRLKNIEYLQGSDHADRLTGDGKGNWLRGNAGADTLDGGAGDDRLWGGPGTDTLNGGPGNDGLYGDGLLGGPGADTLDGGAGSDWAHYLHSAAGVTIDLSATPDVDGYVSGAGGDAEGDRLKNIENLWGSRYGDRLTGDGNDNQLYGSGGDDKLHGGPGADMLDGGAGSDTATYQNSAVAVLVRLHDARAVKFGDAEGDTLTGIEHLVGSRYNDTLAGDGEDNILKGEDGDDVLYGGPAGGDDRMYGGDGDDRLFGGRGNDILTGGEGNDTLRGGPGEDTLIADGDAMDVLNGGPDKDIFQFFPSNIGGGTIQDFTDGEDVIDLTEFTGINSMDDLERVSHGDNVRIEVSGTDYLTTIILSGFDINNLDNSDFLF